MSKIGNNPLLKKVSGKLGDTIVIRSTPNGPVMANAPKKPTTKTAKQTAVRKRFLDAIRYGKRQIAKDDVRAIYKTGVTAKLASAYTVAVSDFLKAPVVQQIDADQYTGAAGQLIRVHASDDFKVLSALVVIKSATGEEIERGEATVSADLTDVWIYTTTAQNPAPAGSTVTATVKDIPGNSATLSVTL